MITLEHDRLEFRFPEVHARARCSIDFQRTLRIPDDGKDYPLPPGLSPFPLRHLDDHAGRLPEKWRRRGGVIMPMHQAEALWLNFDATYPFAVKVATGKVCAITGDAWASHLNKDPQDYLVLPDQPWLDGYCVDEGTIRQFVAMPLGQGYTVEEQLAGTSEHGGLQIVAYPMKRDRYEKLFRDRPLLEDVHGLLESPALDMGLAPGGRMKQEIYADPHDFDVWDQRHGSRCFVTIANAAQWIAITGEKPPTRPPSAKTYTEAGLPWFDYYGGDAEAVAGAEKFKHLGSVAGLAKQNGESPAPEDETMNVGNTVVLARPGPRRVREIASGEMGR